MGNLLLWVHHHGVGGGVGLFIQLRAHDGLDLELDRQHWLWSDPDHAVAILVLLKLRLNVARTCKSIFKNRLKSDYFVTFRDLSLPLEQFFLPPLLAPFLLLFPLQPLPLYLRLTPGLRVLQLLLLRQ